MSFPIGNQYAKKLKGKKQSIEHINKKSESLKKFYKTEKGKEWCKIKSKKQSKTLKKFYKTKKGKLLIQKTKKKLSKILKGKKKPIESKINYQLAMIRRWQNPEYRKKCFATWHSKKYRLNRSKTTKKLWQDENYIEKVLSGLNIGIRKRPTSYEKIIINFIQKYTLPYRYVGDFNFRIGTKNPDFIHTNKKVCVEVYEEFYKIKTFGSVKKYIKDRTKYFKERGWKTIFIDGIQLQNEKLVLELLK